MLKTAQTISWLGIEQWQRFVESNPDRSVFHHRNWLELLSEHYRFPLKIAALQRDSEIQAAIPFLQTPTLRGNRKLISLPFTDYLPTLGNDDSTLEELSQLIQDELVDQYRAIVVRGTCAFSKLPTDSHNVRHELATARPFDEVRSGFASAIRRNLRKGEKQNLSFDCHTDLESVKTFYHLHILTRRKLGVPVQSWTYFRRLHEKLIAAGLGQIGIVTRQNKPIAAVVLLAYGDRLVYKYAASDPASLEYRPNDWLVFNAIRIANREGFRFFDFGITDKTQDGLRRFKSKWGATESDVIYTYLAGEPEIDPGPSTAVQLASRVIKRSPVVVCRALGKVFYRYSQ